MTLLEAYRLALIEGLTAKQAGVKFNLNHRSIAKCKSRYNLPTLKNEWDFAAEKQISNLSDSQLLSYARTVQRTSDNPKWSRHKREVKILNLILEKRKLCLK